MDLDKFSSLLPHHKAILGLDYGEKRLGVAVSDLSCTIATSHSIIYRQSWEKDWKALQKIIDEKEIGGVVLGLPLQMNGQEGEVAVAVRKFAAKIEAASGLPCAFWDERLSSSAMENFLIKEVDMSRGKRKKILDASAAAYILQGFLDALKRGSL